MTFISLSIFAAITSFFKPLQDFIIKVFWQWFGGLSLSHDISELIFGILGNIGQDTANISDAMLNAASRTMLNITQTIITDVFDVILCAIVCTFIQKLSFLRNLEWLSYVIGVIIACLLSTLFGLGKSASVIIEGIVSIALIAFGIKVMCKSAGSSLLKIKTGAIFANGICAVLCILDICIVCKMGSGVSALVFLCGCGVLGLSLFLMWVFSHAASVIEDGGK